MTPRRTLALAVTAALLSACSLADDEPPVLVEAPAPPAAAVAAYDDALEPALAVLALVPESATDLEVTDLGQVRLQLGFGDLDGASAAERDRFWARAAQAAPLLGDGRLATGGALTRDDVDWEARFSGPDGEGWVVRFDDDTSRRQLAAVAGNGVSVVPDQRLALLGAATDPGQSWAADPALTALVGQTAGATYVSRDCVAGASAGGAQVDELGAWSVAFGGTLATVRLGAVRGDVFERARLGAVPGLAQPVADPAGGRIGYRITDAPAAADAVLARRLPFAAC